MTLSLSILFAGIMWCEREARFCNVLLSFIPNRNWDNWLWLEVTNCYFIYSYVKSVIIKPISLWQRNKGLIFVFKGIKKINRNYLSHGCQAEIMYHSSHQCNLVRYMGIHKQRRLFLSLQRRSFATEWDSQLLQQIFLTHQIKICVMRTSFMSIRIPK